MGGEFGRRRAWSSQGRGESPGSLVCPCCNTRGEAQLVSRIEQELMATARSNLQKSWRGEAGTAPLFADRLLRFGLARHFRPPTVPRGYARRAWRLAPLLVGAALLSAALLATNRTQGTSPFLYVCLVVATALIVYSGRVLSTVIDGSLRERVRRDEAAYTHAVQRWEALCYCYNCQRVFTPGDSSCLGPRQVQRYLRHGSARAKQAKDSLR